MRLRLSMKLGALAAMLVMTAFGARACEGGGSGPAGSPAQFLQSGLAGVCADAAATADAGAGDGSPVSLTVPADPALGLSAGALACRQPTSTTMP